jgi:hypothetical protein
MDLARCNRSFHETRPHRPDALIRMSSAGFSQLNTIHLQIVAGLLGSPFGHAKDSLHSMDLFRCESVALRTYWVLVVMDSTRGALSNLHFSFMRFRDMTNAVPHGTGIGSRRVSTPAHTSMLRFTGSAAKIYPATALIESPLDCLSDRRVFWISRPTRQRIPTISSMYDLSKTGKVAMG